MIRLHQNKPSSNFEAGPNMKIYPGAIQKELFDLLDQDSIHNLPVSVILKDILTTNNIVFVRHLESMYNEYKRNIVKTEKYDTFKKTTDPEEKMKIAEELLEDFFHQVGIDYTTDISKEGERQGEELGLNYAELIKENPSLFPSIIYVSPYLRTCKTCHYMLKYVEGLDLDIDKLIDPNNTTDMILGNFQGKPVVLRLDERIRERDHGKNIAPTFLKDTVEGNGLASKVEDKLSYMQKKQLWYYTNPAGGESQVEVNQRIKNVLKSIQAKLLMFEMKKTDDEPKQILVVSHHLAIIAAVQSIFGGTFNTFHQLDNSWKPQNASFTILSQIPKTDSGQENKVRVAGYNMMLKDDNSSD